ncbi:hypothetical protein HB364_22765 [Pseudoflavitalea sp. X16]|uniref:hypothetical protein n=1 Tax=Paraflavitalea devenefica TaxID=2716334 RepID=UPI001423728F|nr:hypothetical protein [Paraflavitalea devenefica]NII27924.1 hypothetical protein [Paraflavitalea devenefica]
MAKVISPFKLSGSLGDLTYFENEYGPQVKEKGGPTKWQVKNLDSMANTRHNAAEWKRATAASKLTRLALGSLRHSVKNIKLSGRMIGRLLAVLKADQVHDRGERVVASGDLSLLTGFEFNYKLSLDDALPLNIANCMAVQPGKVAVNIPAFRLRKKKSLPVDATHYRLVSCILTIDFEKRTFRQDKQEGALQAMGRQTGEGFCIEQVVQPDNEQGCFWLMGIEFYKMVNEQPVVVKGGALRVMEWIGQACEEEPVMVVQDVADEVVLTEAYAGKVEPVEAEMEEIGAAYKEAMEEVLAACLERTGFAEADATITAVEQSALFPETDVVEVEATAAAPVEFIADEVDTVLISDDVEFEKSLRVLLPVEGYQRRKASRSSLAEPFYEPVLWTEMEYALIADIMDAAVD